jgi:phosphate uptake regulator
MPDNRENAEAAAEELEVLSRHLGSLAEIVESVFAESLMVLMESDPGAAQEVRVEDYKAHKAWLQAESLCVDLLAGGDLGLREVQFVTSAIRMTMWLKLTADEAASISYRIREYPPAQPGGEEAMGTLAEMATLTQSMLSDGVAAFLNKDGAEAQRLHLVFRELSSLRKRLDQQAAGTISSVGGEFGPAALSLVLVGASLESIGEYVLELESEISRLYPAEGEEAEPENEG